MNLLVGITLGFALFVFADLALDWLCNPQSSIRQSAIEKPSPKVVP